MVSEKKKSVKLDKELLMSQWELYLQNLNLSGVHTRDALTPHLNPWLDRKHGSLSFRITQLLTGYGCFGTYLHRIGKVPMPDCEHCGEDIEDFAEHTLQECSVWVAKQETLGIALNIDNNNNDNNIALHTIRDS
ncbi:hypothetical protein ACFW04_011985 [Cataglyphis niger]